MLAAVLGFSSCVKNDVSEEVKLLRQGQVDKLNAEVNQILANTNFTNANARYQRLQSSMDSLNFVFALKADEANFVTTLARLNYETKQYQTQLKNEELAFAVAVAAYQKYLAEGTFAANVGEYLTKWNTETAKLTATPGGLYYQRSDLQKAIATAQLMIGGSNLTWDFLKLRLQVQLDAENAKLTAANAALTALQGVLDNPTTLEAEKATLTTQIADLNDLGLALITDQAEANNGVTDATKVITDANAVIALMETSAIGYASGYAKGLVDKNAELVVKTAEIVATNINITTYTTALTLKNATLVSANNELADATTNYNAKLALYNTANTDYNARTNEANERAREEEIAWNDYYGSVVTGTLAQYQAAVNAHADAQTLQASALTVLNNAIAELTLATTTKTSATTSVTVAQAAVTTAQTTLDTEQATLVTKNAQKATIVNAIAWLNTEIAAIKTSYDTAKANMLAYIDTKTAATAALALVNKKIADNNAMLVELNAVLTTLTSHYSTLTTTIATKKTEIQTYENNIANFNKQIADNGFNKIAAQAEIVRMQAELANLEIRITDQVALAAYWKKLLDAAILAG